MSIITSNEIDSLWIFICAFLVFFMQVGFAMLEGGGVRSKNSQNILIKNVLDICLATIAWWLVGYGFAYGKDSNKFIGYDLFVSKDFDNTNHFRDWLFQWAFSATAATIVSGSLAERTHIWAYAIYSIIMTALIYPIIVHWTWGGGFMAEEGYLDFAGSGIVHLTGGIGGIVGTIIVGSRNGRFQKDNMINPELSVNTFKPHNVPLTVLGTLILWFGWYGFNCGSTLSISGSNLMTVGRVGVNTTIGAAIGGIVSFMVNSIMNRNYDKASRIIFDIQSLNNGILAGLVSITAGCNNIEPWAALIIGFIGALVFTAGSKLMLYFSLDDPIDAGPVHGFAGLWGVLAIGFFDKDKGILYGHSGQQLLTQFWCSMVIASWSAITSAVVFLILKYFDILRISEEEELKGMDFVEHGGSGYHIEMESSKNNPISNTQHPTHNTNQSIPNIPSTNNNQADNSTTRMRTNCNQWLV